MKRLLFPTILLFLAQSVLAQSNFPMPKQPPFVEKSGAFPADGSVYAQPAETVPAPAYAYQPPAIPSNFRIYDDMNTLTGGTGDPNASDKKFRSLCAPDKFGFFDSVLAFNRPNWGHLHQFFGNTAANYDSTYFSLRTTGDSTCGGRRLNRSAYWIPAMIDGSKNQAVSFFEAVIYYTRINNDVIEEPRGFHYIGGRNLGDRARTKLNAETGSKWTRGGELPNWKCFPADGSPATDGGDSFLNADGSDRMNNCVGNLIGTVDFPDCWDGVNITAPDGRANVRHSQGPLANGGFSNRRCPPGYRPILIFQLAVHWKVNGYAEYKNWFVSSDRMPGMIEPAGWTFHADRVAGWDPIVFDTWQSQCGGAYTARYGVGRSADCAFSAFGNGWRGKQGDTNPATGRPVVDVAPNQGADKYKPIPGQSMTGFPGIAKGTNIAELMAGHGLKAGSQHTVH